MRAKFVNESYDDNVSYEEAIDFAKEAASQNSKSIYGPAVVEVEKSLRNPRGYYVQTGGVSREYSPEDLDELLTAMETVMYTQHNVTWKILPGNSPKIKFSSDEERSKGNAISQFYKNKPSGGYTGD